MARVHDMAVHHKSGDMHPFEDMHPSLVFPRLPLNVTGHENTPNADQCN